MSLWIFSLFIALFGFHQAPGAHPVTATGIVQPADGGSMAPADSGGAVPGGH
jgi:hypothetical protein